MVDGYNVIRNTPGLAAAEARGGLAAGRVALLEELVARYRHTPHRVVVVFDGSGADETCQAIARLPRGQLIFSRAGETADTAIARLHAREQASNQVVTVISNDLAVRRSAIELGGAAVHSSELATHLNQPSRDVRKRFQYREAIMRQWAKNTAGEQRPARRTGNAHRAPRRQRDERRPPL